MTNSSKSLMIQLLKRAQAIVAPQFDFNTLEIICLVAHAQQENEVLRSERIANKTKQVARCLNSAFKRQSFRREEYSCVFSTDVFMHLLDFYYNRTLEANLCTAAQFLHRKGRGLTSNADYCPKFVILAALTAVAGCEVVCTRNRDILESVGIQYERARMSESSFVCQNLNSDDGDYYSDIGAFIV